MLRQVERLCLLKELVFPILAFTEARKQVNKYVIISVTRQMKQVLVKRCQLFEVFWGGTLNVMFIIVGKSNQ